MATACGVARTRRNSIGRGCFLRRTASPVWRSITRESSDGPTRRSIRFQPRMSCSCLFGSTRRTTYFFCTRLAGRRGGNGIRNRSFCLDTRRRKTGVVRFHLSQHLRTGSAAIAQKTSHFRNYLKTSRKVPKHFRVGLGLREGLGMGKNHVHHNPMHARLFPLNSQSILLPAPSN